MISMPIELPLLYFSIVATILLAREKKPHIFGAIAVATCLLLFDLPDLGGYKEHYRIAAKSGLSFIIPPYNFEGGYNITASIFAMIMPFEAFYVLIVSLAIHAYINFFKKFTGQRHYIFTAFFLSICLYFVAFTIRTTIASIFLAYSLILLRDGKRLIAALMVVIGATFHVVIAPMIILPILNVFSGFIRRRYFLVFIVAVTMAILIARLASLEMFLGVNELLDLKISAYDDANVTSNSNYFVLWLIALFGSLVSYRYFDEFDKTLVIVIAVVILVLYPFGFIQGRLMWLLSFVFAYMFTKSTISRINLGQLGRVVLIITLPLLSLSRF